MNIKLRGSEAEHHIRLWLRRFRSSENCIVGVGVEAEEYTNNNARFRALWLVGALASASDSDNLVSLDHKQRSHERNRKKWKRPDQSSDSDPVELGLRLRLPISIFTRS